MLFNPNNKPTPGSPLSRRVKRLFLWVYLLSVGLILGATWLLLEGMEATTLEMDRQAEVEHFLNRHETDKVLQTQSAMLTMTYLPTNRSAIENLPIIFNNLPIPFEGEVDFLGTEYQVIIGQIPQGTYYLAKNLSRFEHYENLMISALGVLAVLAIISGFGFGGLISRRIAQPIEALTHDIESIKQGDPETYLPETYGDTEVNQVSEALNRYLTDIDQLIQRERSLITMASHELRTPIAVILGAAEVIEKRQQLNGDDQKTLQRIIASANTMSGNINVLLKLVRQSRGQGETQPVPLYALANEVIADLTIAEPVAAQRIEVTASHEVTVLANRDMLKILLGNLVGNGLNHNLGKVSIDFTELLLTVRDEAIKPGSNSTEFSESETSSGLGLYIVTQICDHMGWQFSLVTLPDGQTSACVRFE